MICWQVFLYNVRYSSQNHQTYWMWKGCFIIPMSCESEFWHQVTLFLKLYMETIHWLLKPRPTANMSVASSFGKISVFSSYLQFPVVSNNLYTGWVPRVDPCPPLSFSVSYCRSNPNEPNELEGPHQSPAGMLGILTPALHSPGPHVQRLDSTQWNCLLSY